MSACEECWAEASRIALGRGGFPSDYYRDVLAKNETDHTSPTPTEGATR